MQKYYDLVKNVKRNTRNNSNKKNKCSFNKQTSPMNTSLSSNKKRDLKSIKKIKQTNFNKENTKNSITPNVNLRHYCNLQDANTSNTHQILTRKNNNLNFPLTDAPLGKMEYTLTLSVNCCKQNNTVMNKNIANWINEKSKFKNELIYINSTLNSEENTNNPNMNSEKHKNVYVKIEKCTTTQHDKVENNCLKKSKLDQPILVPFPSAVELNNLEKLNDFNNSTNLSKITWPPILKEIGLQPCSKNIDEELKKKEHLKRRCLTRSIYAELNKGRNLYDIINPSKKQKKHDSERIIKSADLQIRLLDKPTFVLCKPDMKYQLTESAINLEEPKQLDKEIITVSRPKRNLENDNFKNNNNKLFNNIKNSYVDLKQNNVLQNNEEITKHLLLEKSFQELIDKVQNTEETSKFAKPKIAVLRLLKTALSKYKLHMHQKLNLITKQNSRENLSTNISKTTETKKNKVLLSRKAIRSCRSRTILT